MESGDTAITKVRQRATAEAPTLGPHVVVSDLQKAPGPILDFLYHPLWDLTLLCPLKGSRASFELLYYLLWDFTLFQF
jgi:hypothetical protein